MGERSPFPPFSPSHDDAARRLANLLRFPPYGYSLAISASRTLRPGPLLEISDLHRVGLTPAKRFSLPDGTCIAVRGPSGAGKTLLMRAIADLDPNEGRVALDGEDRAAMPAPLWRRRVTYVPAEPGWWADTIGEHFVDWAGALPLIERVGLTDAAKSWPVARCSTGERPGLALVRAPGGRAARASA